MYIRITNAYTYEKTRGISCGDLKYTTHEKPVNKRAQLDSSKRTVKIKNKIYDWISWGDLGFNRVDFMG